MPEFILNKPSPDHWFYHQSPFVQGYVEAMFFTGDGEDYEGQFNVLGVAKLSRDAMKRIEKDCKEFLSDFLTTQAFWLAYANGYSESQAGRDFWYTRQRHGVGYWDRDELFIKLEIEHRAVRRTDETTVGQFLTDQAHKIGEVYPNVWRKRIWVA